MTQSDRKITAAVTGAAVLGALPCALSLVLVIAVFLPVAPKERIIGSGVVLPVVWVALVIGVVHSRKPARAWAALGLTTVGASALVALRSAGAL